jgi:thymidylate synthase
MNNTDKEYFRLLNTILEKGRLKKNRTGINTIGVFGEQAKYDIDMNAFPILTTKKIHFPAIVHELLWFIKGDTNIKYLVDNNVRIWNEWAYKRYTDAFTKLVVKYAGATIGNTCLTQEEFVALIKSDDKFAKEYGELGEGTYGGMWRAFPYYAEEADGDQYGLNGAIVGVKKTVDQLQKVLDKLKTNPDDRRIIVSAWHPYWVDHCALPPCHCMFHFNTEELTLDERIRLVSFDDYAKMGNETKGKTVSDEFVSDWMDKLNIPKRKLNCLLYQRSCDTFLGVPFNITSYALLTAMIAHVSGMACGTFTHTYGDLHIYENHKEQVKLQLSREPTALPKLWLNPDVKSLFDFKYEDIKLEGYDPHPAIKGEVAV